MDMRPLRGLSRAPGIRRPWPRGLAGAALGAAAVALGACGGTALQPGPSPNALPSLQTVQADTPLLADAGYVRQSGSYGPGITVYGKPGAIGLQLLVNGAGRVVAVRGVFPKAVGLQPWYDQATGSAGAPATRTAAPAGTASGTSGTASGTAAAPRVSGTPAAPQTRAPGTAAPARSPSPAAGTARRSPTASTTPTASGTAPRTPGASAAGATSGAGAASGAARGPAASKAPARPKNAVRTPRAATGASSGTAPAPPDTYTQTVWLVAPQAAAGATASPAMASQSRLLAINPTLAGARRITGFVPGMGYHVGHQGYGLVVMFDRSGRLTGVEGYFPLNMGFQPMYDQLPGHVDAVPALHLQGYSQHVFFVAPTTIR